MMEQVRGCGKGVRIGLRRDGEKDGFSVFGKGRERLREIEEIGDKVKI
ncbi:hypothetical protein [Staphylococcus auricularis]|nr:hypothetical protein [Staphylococcus auricularis]